MRRPSKFFIATLCLLVFAPSGAWAQPDEKPAPDTITPDQPTPETSADAKPAAAAETNSTTQTIVYRPPRRGSPRARVGGGVRAARVALPQPLALAPQDHVGLTTRAAPALYWHLDGTPPADVEVVFALTDPDQIDPLVRTDVATPAGAGIQRLSLADLGVTLAPAVEYQWSISLIVDPQNPAKDLVSSGFIARTADVIVANTPEEMASQGLWYDAMDALSDALAANPDDGRLRGERAQLIEQAGIADALEPER